jgi:hypothetical protein
MPVNWRKIAITLIDGVMSVNACFEQLTETDAVMG